MKTYNNLEELEKDYPKLDSAFYSIFQNENEELNFGQTGTTYKSKNKYFFEPDGMSKIFEINKKDFFIDPHTYPIK